MTEFPVDARAAQGRREIAKPPAARAPDFTRQLEALADAVAKRFAGEVKKMRSEIKDYFEVLEYGLDRRMDEIESAMLRRYRRALAEARETDAAKDAKPSSGRKNGTQHPT